MSSWKILFIIAIILFLSLYLFTYYASFDKAFKIKTGKNGAIYFFSDQVFHDIQAILQKNYNDQLNSQQKLKKTSNSKFKKDLPLYYCINGQNPEKLTKKEYIFEFIKGPCAPVVVVPGHQGTILRTEVNCEQLREQSPDVFQSCGWNSCEGGLFKSVPAKEYTIWLPPLESPMNLFALDEKNSVCLGAFLELHLEKSLKHQIQFVDTPGLRTSWFGNTEETKSQSQCGFKAIQNLFPIQYIQPGPTAGFQTKLKYLENLGYVKALTMQAIPYDFRKSISTNKANLAIINSVDHLYNITGKKVVISAHSLGALVTLKALNQMDAQEKQKKILHFVDMAGPFMGAVEALQTMIGGYDLYKFNFNIGFQLAGQKKFLQGLPSIFDLLPKPIKQMHQDSEWFKELILRNQLELEHLQKSGYGLKFQENTVTQKIFSKCSLFPLPNQNCSRNFKSRNEHCFLGIDNILEHPIVIIKNISYYTTRDNILEVLNQHSLKKQQNTEFWLESEKSEIDDLKNPEVPTSLLYYSHLNTTARVIYNQNPTEKTDINQFYLPDTKIFQPGDGTVTRNSFIIPGYKWLWEHTHNIPNSQTIRMVDLCSTYNLKNSVYEQNSERKLKDSDFHGWYCQCNIKSEIQLTSGLACDHNTIVNDIYVLNYLGQILDAREQVNIEDTLSWQLSEEQLNDIYEKCTPLTPLGLI